MSARLTPLFSSCFSVVLLFQSAGCRAPQREPVGAVLADVEESSPDDSAAGSGCDDILAADTADLDGEATFALTTRCVFNQEVHELRIRILSETFAKVLDDGCADRDTGYGHVQELILNGQRIADVGIKVRGNTSKCNPKRQFKFKFDAKKLYSVWQGQQEIKEFPANKGRRFFGLEGFSVRTSANDPSMIRERLSSDVFAHGETLAPTTRRGALVYRTAFTKLYVSFNRKESEGPQNPYNRLYEGRYYDYKGFYSLAENIDETLLETRFQEGDVPLEGFYLFKADLAKARFDRATYSRKGWSQELVDGKEPKDAADLAKGDAKLFELFDLLAEPDVTDGALADAIDVASFATYVAAAQLAGHWDSLLANRNNDYLVFDGTARKWKMLTWDLDNTLGALKPQYDALMSNDIYHPATANRSKAYEVLFGGERQAFRDVLKDRLKGYLTTMHQESAFSGRVAALREQVKGNIEPWEGFDAQSYENLKSFVAARRAEIAPQVGL